MSSDISYKLGQLGLSEKEALVYLALLKLGTAHVRDLVIETDLNRSTMYVVLDQLMKLGFVSISNRRGVRTYTSAPPERLLEAVREKARQDVMVYETFSALRPELSDIRKNKKFKPRITIFEGTSGLKKAFEDVLNSEEKVMRVFSSAEDIYRSLPDYLPIFIEERMKRKIKMYGVHPDDPMARQVTQHIPPGTDEVTLIPSDKFNFPSDVAVYDNTVAFMSHRPPFSVKIESREMARMVKELMDLARIEAKRFKL